MFYKRLVDRTTKNLDKAGEGSPQKLKSAIINMSSAYSYQPMTVVLEYSAAKAFLRHFTLGLAEEAHKNLDILCVCPGFVSTNICANRVNFDTISAATCVNGVLKALGQQRETTSCLIHDLIFKAVLQSLWYISHEVFTKVLKFMEEANKTNVLAAELLKREKESFKQ